MKRKTIAMLAGIFAFAMVAGGCSGKEISDEYITISQYKGVEVEVEEASAVTDEDVDAEIKSILEGNATNTEVTGRAVQEGDIATIDYVGKKDGVAFDGGTAEDYALEIGSDTFIDGFEDGIIGHSTGETFDLNLTFPENYGNTELAGQPVVFTVTIKSVMEKNIPELTDEFVQQISETSKTAEEFREEVKKELEENQKNNQILSLKEGAWNAVLDNTEVKNYPQDMLDEVSQLIREQYENMADSYGMGFDEFLQSYMGMDENGFNEQLAEAAKNQVKQELVMDLIIKKAKLDLSDKVKEEYYDKYVEDYGFESLDALKEAASEEELENMVKFDVVQEYLADNCKQVSPS